MIVSSIYDFRLPRFKTKTPLFIILFYSFVWHFLLTHKSLKAHIIFVPFQIRQFYKSFEI